MSIAVPLRIGGGMVSWDLSPSNRAKLLRGLEGIFLDSFMPAPKTPQACLSHALRHSEVFEPSDKKNKILIRPLENNEGFTVKEEVPGQDDNDYPQLASAKLVGGEGAEDIEVSPYPGSDEMDAIRDAFREAAATVSASSLGTALVKIVESGFGVPVTPAGHTYFIPAEKLDGWNRIVSVVEAAATEDNKSEVYCVHAVADDNLIKCIGAFLSKEIRAEVAQINEEVASDSLGITACENRAKRAEKLLGKVAKYEECFRRPLDELTESLKEAQKAAALAAIKAAAKNMAATAA